MKTAVAVIATDLVNRQLMQTPLSGLIWTIENMLEESVRARIAAGMPMNNSHDQHMPLGWSIPRGVFVAKDMGRLLALILVPETDEERNTIAGHRAAFRRNLEFRRAQPHEADLRARLKRWLGDGLQLLQCEAVAIEQLGLAEAAAPEFFTAESPLVDKDGLVDYAALLERTTQVAPGIFHCPARDLIFFAHPYFRRSLSRDNSLNGYALRSFHETAMLDGVAARLKLDPDLVGHPDSVTEIMELEYWNGPLFNDDISTIKSGVAEHAATERDRLYSQIDRTHIWWKAPEQRGPRDDVRSIRTFEIEELILRPSAGLAGERYGCRYAHAEYDLALGALSHFDGAVRAYDEAAYRERCKRRIDRGGKHSVYQKLFRFDGAIPVANWKRVLTDYFRGNNLVPEYLGGPQADAKVPDVEAEEPPIAEPALSFFVGLHASNDPPPESFQICSDQKIDWAGRLLSIVEIGPGRLGDALSEWVDRSRLAMVFADSPVVNLSSLVLPGFSPHLEVWRAVAERLTGAIRQSTVENGVERLSISIRWQDGNIVKVLAMAGIAGLVADLLDQAREIVKPEEPPSTWIEPLRDALVALAPDLNEPVHASDSAAFDGRILLERPCQLELNIALPQNSTHHAGP